MYNYIEDIIGTALLDMNGVGPDPAKGGLFTVDKLSSQMNADGVDFFHSMTARLLFAVKRARPDIQVAVAYLCTRVRD